MAWRYVGGAARHALRALLYATVGGLVVAIALMVQVLTSRPDLSAWHLAPLDEEFRQGSDVDSFAEYLALEERLFAQLGEEVVGQVAATDKRDIARYHAGSLADPERWPRNWNRSFELAAEGARAGVLLLHGMSDSPYSLRELGERLHAEGAHVLGLRIPGHGTAPSGLVHVRWQDMAAAVRLAVRHLRETLGPAPILLVGYSNGAALAVEYSLSALEDSALPAPAGLVLISPAIGITRLAGLAVWQERLGHLLGLEKLSWNTILSEWDPFKYNSFALNAGKQAHGITVEIRTRIAKLAAEGSELARFPPTLTFQSVVDATVSAPALVTDLYDPLPAKGGHELVIFDINRQLDVEMLLRRDPAQWLEEKLAENDPSFTLSAVMNENEATDAVVLRQLRAGASRFTEEPLGLRWPENVYSLAHISLPFSPEDPLYGGPDAAPSPGIHLGELALRGERGVLETSASDMLRLRWNPFYEWLEERVVGWMNEAVSREAAANGGASGAASVALGAEHASDDAP